MRALFLMLALSLSAPQANAGLRRTLPADPDFPKAPIVNFHRVSGGLFRGAIPNEEGLKFLQSLNVKTDIDLEAFREDRIISEKDHAPESGIGVDSIRVWSFPSLLGAALRPVFHTSGEAIDRALDEMKSAAADPSKGAYVHCTLGRDRTGMLVGIYRVNFDHWSRKQAWEEMCKYDFEPKFTELVRVFKNRTKAAAQKDDPDFKSCPPVTQ